MIIISQIKYIKKISLTHFILIFHYTRQSIKFIVQVFFKKLKGRNIKKMGIKYKCNKNYQECIKKVKYIFFNQFSEVFYGYKAIEKQT